MKLLKRIAIAVALCCIIICLGFIMNNPTKYNNNYWKDIGLKQSHLYEDVENVFGEPLYIDSNTDEHIVMYEGIDFVWSNVSLQGAFLRAEVHDNNISFGKKHIGVGSSKEEVIKAYNSKYIKQIKDLKNNSIGYIDGNDDIWVIYEFNNINNVEKVILSSGI